MGKMRVRFQNAGDFGANSHATRTKSPFKKKKKNWPEIQIPAPERKTPSQVRRLKPRYPDRVRRRPFAAASLSPVIELPRPFPPGISPISRGRAVTQPTRRHLAPRMLCAGKTRGFTYIKGTGRRISESLLSESVEI